MKFRLDMAGAGVLAVSLATGMPALAAEQGVTDKEIVLGAHIDMSGPFAAFGAPAAKAAQMYFKEINDKGGIHGRKIKYIVEDHAYQMPKAIQAVNKLVNRDKIFIMFMALGTPMNLAAFKITDAKGIPNVSPLSAARQMLQAPIDLKFTGFSTYFSQIKSGVSYLTTKNGRTTVCSMFIPSDFGKEIQAGAKAEAKTKGLKYATETTHKPDETDYVGSLGKLKSAGCDLVALALSVRGTITAVATAKKLGWTNVDFLTSSAGFHTAVAKVPGGITEGLYATAGWADLASRMSDPVVKAWVTKWIEATGEKFPGTGALLGRSAAETVVRGLQAAGKDLNANSFRKGMESLNFDDKIAGNKMDYSATDHQGADVNIISVVKNGNWQEVHRE